MQLFYIRIPVKSLSVQKEIQFLICYSCWINVCPKTFKQKLTVAQNGRKEILSTEKISSLLKPVTTQCLCCISDIRFPAVLY